MRSIRIRAIALAVVLGGWGMAEAAEPLRVGVFDVDASPPVGSPLAYDPTEGVQMPLHCRGVVLIGAEDPVVLCAVDWIGIGNDGNKAFRSALAEAAGTTPDRVAVHALHQHDAPRCDFSTDELLAEYGLQGQSYDSEFARDVIARAAEALRQAVAEARAVTHLGLGQAEVEKVASNRRIFGPDGKVVATRYTATKDPELRAAPVGTIDPLVRSIQFWNEDEPLAVLTYYATHPQSYYRTGLANPDFPGMARQQREAATGTFHVHFNGAGGNIGAGKWNDGAPENRQILANRLADGMERALQTANKVPVDATELVWETVPVVLSPAPHLVEDELVARLEDESASAAERSSAAHALIWLRRCQEGDPIDVACLRVGPARVLHLPGELFVEYQLAAQALRPDAFVAMAAYGDYAPGYIGTEVAYSEGGYETSQRASKVAPETEGVLMDAIKTLLNRTD